MGTDAPGPQPGVTAPHAYNRLPVLHVPWMPPETTASTIAAAQRRWLLHSIRQGAGLFVVFELLVSPLGLFPFMVAAMVGTVVGYAWERLSLGQVGAPALAMAASFVHQALMLNSGGGSIIAILLAPLVIGSASSWLGIRRDMRPFD